MRLARKRNFPLRKCGFTLMELLVVLVILGAVGTIVMITVSSDFAVDDGTGSSVTSREVATRATFAEVEKALLGDASSPGYHTHNLELPTQIEGLFADVDSVGSYDFVTRRGWNGPYLIDTGARYVEDAVNFTDTYGDDGDPAVLDAWGRPIILQQPKTADARLVSAGLNGFVETDPDDPIDGDRGDDLVQFLRTVDPNLN